MLIAVQVALGASPVRFSVAVQLSIQIAIVISDTNCTRHIANITASKNMTSPVLIETRIVLLHTFV